MAMIIAPDRGREAEIGRRLLNLATGRGQVRWVTYPDTGFEVTDEIYHKFHKTFEADPQVKAEQAPKKKRGRPRKNSPVEE